MAYYYSSLQTGAPVLSGTAGALKTVLKTCLVDGFGAGAVQSLEVAAGMATVTFAGAHPYIVDSPIVISGADPAELSGVHRVVWASAASVRFAAAGVVDGVATGSITHQVPGAGWQELFSGSAANVLALQPLAPEGTGCVLRVDDAGTVNARVRSYESMSDIDTGIGPSPLDAQVAGGGWWPKSNTAGAAARPWLLVADARGFHLFVDVQANGRYTSMWNGDVASLKSGDAWSCMISCNAADQTGAAGVPDACNGFSGRSARAGAYMQRAYSGVGGAIGVQRAGAAHNGPAADVWSGGAGYTTGGDAYPNGPNNGLLIGPVELSDLGIRGTLPGLFHVRGNAVEALATGSVLEGTADMVGHRLLAVRVGAPSSVAQRGTALVDLTGPWGR